MKQTKKISHKKPIRKRTFRKETRNVHKKSRNKSYKKIKGGVTSEEEEKEKEKEEEKLRERYLVPDRFNGNTVLHADLEIGTRTDVIKDHLINITRLFKESREIINARHNKYLETPLHIACRKNNAESATLLIENGAAIDAINKFGETPLHYAVWKNNMDLATLLIKKGAAIDARDSDGETPLHFACRLDNTVLTTLLIKNHADMNASDNNGNTPLHSAIFVEKTESANLLINGGATIDAINNNGETPLHVACRIDSINHVQNLINVQNLIKKGADVTAKITYPDMHHQDWFEKKKDDEKNYEKLGKGNGTALGETPLSIVCKKGDTALLKLIINTKEEVDSKSIPEIINSTNEYQTFDDDKRKWVRLMTPLHYAARYGTPDQVKFLIEKGAKVNAKDSNDWTPLQHACGRSTKSTNNVEVTQTLIEKMEGKKIEINKVLGNNYCHGTKMNMKLKSISAPNKDSFFRTVGRYQNFLTTNDVDREQDLINKLIKEGKAKERKRVRERERQTDSNYTYRYDDNKPGKGTWHNPDVTSVFSIFNEN